MNTDSSRPGPSSSILNWTPPPTLPSRVVYPDTYTTKEEMAAAPGNETDPGRMAIYLCLLDERPHLHPSLAALHKHRHVAHGIPLPAKPESDLPVSSKSIPTGTSSYASSDTMEVDIPIIQVQSSIDERAGIGAESSTGGVDQERAEWLIWRFTEEEEARRKAYLPLS